MKAVKLFLLVLVVVLSGCGANNVAAPADAGTPTSPSASGSGGSGGNSNGGGNSTPPTVLSFIHTNSAGICDAIENWDPDTETIFFPVNAGANPGTYYSFEADGVFWANPDGSHQPGFVGFGGGTQVITKTSLNATVCTITVTNGEFIGVN